MNQKVIDWLLEGDCAIRYQVYRDLLGENRPDLRQQIQVKGWGKKFLEARNSSGHWGQKFYQPKWISSHYTLLDLRHLCISPDLQEAKETINIILAEEKNGDSGIMPYGYNQKCDVCVNGMFLNYAAYFQTPENDLKSVIDFILSMQLTDGGFNCMLNRSGARHSSLHSTISVMEGFTEYLKNTYTYRTREVEKQLHQAKEFILLHQFYRSDKTAQIIHKDFLRLAYPSRWKYDILRALDLFQYADFEFDSRMVDALGMLREKQNADGTWNMQAKHPGAVHFEMEKAGKPGRWNTLRALRVLKKYG